MIMEQRLLKKPLFNFDCAFIVISIWRQMVWDYHICIVVFGDVDFKINNISMNE